MMSNKIRLEAEKVADEIMAEDEVKDAKQRERLITMFLTGSIYGGTLVLEEAAKLI